MPSAIPLGLGLAGSLFGAGAKSGKQGGTNTQSQEHDITNQNTTGTMTPNEPGYATAFRQQSMGDINKAIGQAEAPVYGDAQKANYLNSLNDLATSSMDSLKQNLARSGALSSGRLAQGMTDIDMGRNAQAAGFFSQIPFLNAQARSAQLNPLLATQAGLAGHAPVGYTQSGTLQSTEDKNKNTQSQVQGPGFLQNFMGGLGSMFGAGAAGQGPLGKNPFAFTNNWGNFGGSGYNSSNPYGDGGGGGG